MGKSATVVELSEEDRAVLEGWVRASTTEQRLVQRGEVPSDIYASIRTNDSPPCCASGEQSLLGNRRNTALLTAG